jgi:hypothetical protein
MRVERRRMKGRRWEVERSNQGKEGDRMAIEEDQNGVFWSWLVDLNTRWCSLWSRAWTILWVTNPSTPILVISHRTCMWYRRTIRTSATSALWSVSLLPTTNSPWLMILLGPHSHYRWVKGPSQHNHDIHDLMDHLLLVSIGQPIKYVRI